MFLRRMMLFVVQAPNSRRSKDFWLQDCTPTAHVCGERPRSGHEQFLCPVQVHQALLAKKGGSKVSHYHRADCRIMYLNFKPFKG